MSDWTQTSMTWREFANKGLNIPGTLVEVKFKDRVGNKQKEQFLIGDINTIGGVCDDCVAFSHDATVTKYKVLAELPKKK